MRLVLGSLFLTLVATSGACSSADVFGPVGPGPIYEPPPPTPAPAPTITELVAGAPILAPSQSSSLRWTVNTTSARIVFDPPLEPSSQPDSTPSVRPTKTTTYTMTVSNESGTTSKSVRVEVLPGVATKLKVRSMICDATHGTILATVDAKDPVRPNSLAFVNATTGAIERWVEVGKGAGQVALSDDATTAWVGVDGENGFRKVDTATLARGPLHYFPELPPPNGGIYAASIVVLAGSTTSIAIARDRDFAFQFIPEGVAVYDDGVPRAVMQERGPLQPTYLARSAAANELYAIGPYGRGEDLHVLSIAADGVRELEKKPNIVDRSARTIELADGRLYFSNGTVLSAAGARLGTVLLLGSGGVDSIVPHPPSQTIFATSSSQVSAVDLEAFTPRASYRPSFGQFAGVVRCGPSVVTRLSDDTLLFIPASYFDKR